ncbi:sugar phosphate isomerase/epimerase family protein [Pseudomonas costantinii]|uniref:sugar phosphate isomerase/epimerase family protein n=1 Tax=Pseudomonas costantinii TaxID=168469 RepID=UPI0015A1A955|nr:TIM barrel protein [Pseudomonas costantinii]NVZ72982.1 sugar phosphate isomerase/epimerase [Pseudomonas costantinii]
MRLAISNIAWDVSEDEAIANLLNQYSIDAIDIAPGKYFPNPAAASDEDIENVRQWWFQRGIEITGMQALLFGTTGLNVFGARESQEALLSHLGAVCRIGAGLGATRLVFGSPKNRDRSGLDDEQAMNIAIPFFKRLGDIAQAHDVIICLEPNPPCYGANFMTTSAETALVVKSINHPAIKMQLDTGAISINGESASTILSSDARLIGHIHASEPDLMPLGDRETDHQSIYSAVSKFLPSHLISIEMVATKDEPHLSSIERALSCAIQYYRPTQGSKQ